MSGFSDYLKDNPTLKIAIHGHTDDIGDANKNLTLSINRSQAVKDFLVEKGIDITRINSEGFGESKPKVSNNSDENRAVNRRTEFQLLAD